MKKFTMVLAAFAVLVCLGITVNNITLIHEAKEEQKQLQIEFEKAQQEYNEAISDFNADEMYILNCYSPWLAGYAYGYRQSLESYGDIVISERIHTVAHGIYQISFETLDGDYYEVTLTKTAERT